MLFPKVKEAWKSQRGKASHKNMNSSVTIKPRWRVWVAGESSGKSWDVTASLHTLDTDRPLTVKSVCVCVCVFIRKSVCACVCLCVCSHTYTNCGVSYIRGTLTPFFCAPGKTKTKKKIKKNLIFILIIWLQVFKPRPQKNTNHVRRPTWPP